MISGFFRLSVFLLILALIASVVAVSTSARQALSLLSDYGYAAYLGVQDTNTTAYFFACMRDGVCSDNFATAWKHAYPTGLLIGVAVLVLVVIGLGIAYRATRRRKFDPATGRWSTIRDLKKRGYYYNPRDPKQRGYAGMHPSGKMLRVPEHIRFSHSLVLGGPGARKSTGYHWQNILQDADDGVSVIVFDLKFPDPTGGFVSALPYFEKKGYDVYAFTPYSDVTHNLPLVADAVDEMVARDIAEMLIPPSEDGNAGFFRNTERSILAGLLMHTAHCNISLTELHSIVLGGPKTIRSFINGGSKYKAAVPMALDMVGALLNAEPKDQQGLARGIEGKLQFFANENLGKATRLSDDPWLNIPLDQIGKKKSFLYVGLPQKYIDGGSGKLLLQLIKRMIDSALSETAYQNFGKVPNPVSFYLDEFPSFGKLPNVESNFATMRSRQVAYHLTLQNISQGKAIYTDAGFKSFFTSNFQTIMLFPSFIKFEDAQYISQILGNTMTTMYGDSQSTGGLHDTTSHNERESTRPLVTIDEMQTWPANEAIVILNGVPHTRVIVPGIWEKRSGGVRNPYYAAFSQLDQRLDVDQYIQGLVDRTKKVHVQQKLQERRALIAEIKAAHAPAEPETITVTASSSSASEAAEPPTLNTTSAARRKRTSDDPLNVMPDPSTVTAVATAEGRKVVPRDAINQLVSHIATISASVKVDGNRKKKRIKQMMVPTEVIHNLFKPDQVDTLIEEGYFQQKDHYMLVQLDKDGLLQPHFAKWLLKQLPQNPGKDVDYNEARDAFFKGVESILDNDLDLELEINGRTREIQRVKFNLYAMPEELREKYQDAWVAHEMMRIRSGMAFGTQRIFRAAHSRLRNRLLDLYDARRGKTTPAEPAQAAAAAVPKQTPAKQAPERTERTPTQRPQPQGGTPSQGSAPQQRQPQPAVSTPTAVKQPTAATAAAAQAPTDAVTNVTPPAAATAQQTPSASQRPMPAAEQQTPAEPAPAVQTPPTQAPAAQGKAISPTLQAFQQRKQNASGQPPAASPVTTGAQRPTNQGGRQANRTTAQPETNGQATDFTWWPRPNASNPSRSDYVLIPTDSAFKKKLRNFIVLKSGNLLKPDMSPSQVTNCIGRQTPSRYILHPETYAQQADQPALPELGSIGVERRTMKLNGGVVDAIIIDPDALRKSGNEQARATLDWFNAHTNRIDGHPFRDESEPALRGLSYEPGILTIDQRELNQITEVPNEYAGLDNSLPVGPVIRVYTGAC